MSDTLTYLLAALIVTIVLIILFVILFKDRIRELTIQISQYGLTTNVKTHIQEGEVNPPTRENTDLQKFMFNSFCSPLGDGPNRIFHINWPYILPVCFKPLKRSEFNYIVVGESIEDESNLIKTEPSLTKQSISSVRVGNTRWYRILSSTPLSSIEFKELPKTKLFATLNAEIYPLGTWNHTPPIVVPKGLSEVYALAVTEQIGSSTWFVSIDDVQYTFNHNLGCHLVELSFSDNKPHNLSLGYKDGSKGIACAFFAF